MTPMVKQYFDLKARANDAILFFRMGDFYEVFGDDAATVSQKVDIVLTARESGAENKIPFCGVPHHSARVYWQRLIKMGFKVAIADQLEDATQAKGLVHRDIIKILSPGCVDDIESLESQTPNYLAALYEIPEAHLWSAAFVDISTGELLLGNVKKTDLPALLMRLTPRELVVRRFARTELEPWVRQLFPHETILVSDLPEAPLRDGALQKKLLQQVFGKSSVKDFSCGAVQGGEALASAILAYLQDMHFSLAVFRAIKPLQSSSTMALSATALRDLEILESQRRRSADGSLLKIISRTVTPLGARLLRSLLLHPSLCVKEITARHDAVEAFCQRGEIFLTKLRDIFRHCGDLERLASRVVMGTVTPIELAKLRVSLKAILRLNDFLRPEKIASPLLKEKIAVLSQAQPLVDLLDKALQELPQHLGRGDQVFVAGFDQELDKLVDLARHGNDKVAQYENQLRTQSGISSLKIRDHKSLGLLIEITKSNLSRVPAEFIRRQTMVNCERYSTPELKDLEVTLSSAMEQAVAKEQELFAKLVTELSGAKEVFFHLANAAAWLDVLQSHGWLACREDYVRPAMVPHGKGLRLDLSRHPVVEAYVGKHAFTPNDVQLQVDQPAVLLTGPNMGGKSTIMRQVALAAIMAQSGAFVAAKKAQLPVFDQIFTRVGAADDLAAGQSTFMVEMSEAADMLRHATNKSLLILDELGRGTSTQDGVAIAKAVLEEVVKKLRCICFFSTHYHELVPFTEETLPQVSIRHMEVIEEAEGIKLTHRFKAGPSAGSFGLNVARLAGVPEDVVRRAATLAQEDSASKPKQAAADVTRVQRQLFGLENQAGQKSSMPNARVENILERLRGIRLNRTTPLQALNILSELKELLNAPAQRELFFTEDLAASGRVPPDSLGP